MINIIRGTLNIPATIVKGSPTKGTHERNKDHLPYFKYHKDTLCNCFFLKGNQLLFINFVIYDPKYQLIIEPNILPKLAKKISKNCENFYQANNQKRIQEVNIELKSLIDLIIEEEKIWEDLVVKIEDYN